MSLLEEIEADLRSSEWRSSSELSVDAEISADAAGQPDSVTSDSHFRTSVLFYVVLVRVGGKLKIVLTVYVALEWPYSVPVLFLEGRSMVHPR